MYQEITLRQLEKPHDKKLPADVLWVCDSFGLTSGRDLEQLSSRIFLDFLEKFSSELRVSSEALAEDLEISPARVNHHLRNLMDSGIIYRERRHILLRGGSLKGAVEEMRKDADRIFDELSDMAEEIDKNLGLKNRG